MGYREATDKEKALFCETALQVRSGTQLEVEIDRKHRRLIKRSSLEGDSNIGGLGERTMHLVFKYFLEPCSDYHEVSVGKHYADIMRDGVVTEIQTKNFCSFRKKLAAVSEAYPVRIVHPIIKNKTLYMIDGETEEIDKGRKSPVHEGIYSVFRELVYIRELLQRDNLSFIFPVIECDSYRVMYKKDVSRRKGSLHYDTVPTSLIGFYEYDTAFAFASLLPYTDRELTVKSIARLIGDSRNAPTFVNVLMYLDILKKDGKTGRANRYVYGENY